MMNILLKSVLLAKKKVPYQAMLLRVPHNMSLMFKAHEFSNVQSTSKI